MRKQHSFIPIVLLLFTGLILICLGCSKTNEVNIAKLLPEGAVKEITHAYPDFKVTFVTQEEANVSVTFGEKYLCVEGIEKEETREKMAKYVLQYLENPNKKAEDKAKREAYEKLPAKERMNQLIEKTKKQYPGFDYKWVGLKKGNVKAAYGDNSLLITGVENDGAREEYAHAIIHIQMEIDKESGGDVKEHSHEQSQEHEHEEGEEHEHEHQ